MLNVKSTLVGKIEVVKNILEIAAIGAVAFFFFYKILGGWLVVNVALTVSLDRQPNLANSETDYIAITLNIEKKEAGSVVLESVRARIFDLENEKEIDIVSLQGIEKLEYTQNSHEWQLHTGNLKQRLTPGTTTQLSGIIEVPKNVPVLVDVSLVSKRDFSFSLNQIRATKISLSISKSSVTDQ